MRVNEYTEADWAPIDPLLGTMLDVDIIKLCPMGHSVVYERRKKLGIPRYRSQKKQTRRRAQQKYSNDEMALWRVMQTWKRPDEVEEEVRKLQIDKYLRRNYPMSSLRYLPDGHLCRRPRWNKCT